MIRIYADFNHRDEQGRVILDTVGSLHDIEENHGQISEGMNVILYMDDDVEVEGRLVFDDVWMAIPDFTTVHLIGSDGP